MHGVSDLVALPTATIKETPLTHVKAEALEATVAQAYNWVSLTDVALHLKMRKKVRHKL